MNEYRKVPSSKDDFDKFSDNSKSDFELIENKVELDNSLGNLSAIEQAVIFLLFKEELSQDEASKILEICSKSVSRIKIRAINKLKKFMKGEVKNG